MLEKKKKEEKRRSIIIKRVGVKKKDRREAYIRKRGRVQREQKDGTQFFVISSLAGLKNKGKNFWKGLNEWDVIVLTETWTEGKEWEKVKYRLLKGYV